MKSDKIMTIRDGQWKLFLNKPRFYKEADPSSWKDKRAPDGITIIAPTEQATPADYPGIKPRNIEGDWFLFNLNQDRVENINVSKNNSKIINRMRKQHEGFVKSLHELQ